MPKRRNFKTYMGKDGISFQPKMSTNKQIKVRTQVLCKDLRYPGYNDGLVCLHTLQSVLLVFSAQNVNK